MSTTRISDSYLKMNRQLHAAPRGFGGSGHRWVDLIHPLLDKYQIRSLLDYGCGQEKLWESLQEKGVSIAYVGYDPCLKGKDHQPVPAELVTCTDVLEHVELEYLHNVLSHIYSLTEKVAFFNIALHPANKLLPDGRNAHLIQKPKEWWLTQLGEFFMDWRVTILPSPRPQKDFLLYYTRCPE